MNVLERAYEITFAKDIRYSHFARNASTEWSNGTHSVRSPVSGCF